MSRCRIQRKLPRKTFFVQKNCRKPGDFGSFMACTKFNIKNCSNNSRVNRIRTTLFIPMLLRFISSYKKSLWSYDIENFLGFFVVLRLITGSSRERKKERNFLIHEAFSSAMRSCRVFGICIYDELAHSQIARPLYLALMLCYKRDQVLCGLCDTWYVQKWEVWCVR